jgi:hypothetical protein
MATRRTVHADRLVISDRSVRFTRCGGSASSEIIGRWLIILVGLWRVAVAPSSAAAQLAADFSGYRADCGIIARQDGDRLTVSWPFEGDESGRLVLDLRPGQPLFGSIAIVRRAGDSPRSLIENADPVTFLLVGSRQAPAGRPPEMSVFNVFFDAPATRHFETFRSQLELKHVRVSSTGRRATVSLADVRIGPFTGELRITFYEGARLVHVETVVHTPEDRRAILYDTGLAWSLSDSARFAWVDTEGKLERSVAEPTTLDHAEKARHRTLLLERDNGSIACFPPPHQFFFPRDLTDNLHTLWLGHGHRGLDPRFGFGIRQSERGGGSYVPWFNAPPGTDQHLGVFYLLSSGQAEQALEQTLRYTNRDRFLKLPGYHTLTSHWHMATAMAALAEKQKGGPRTEPDFVRMFQDMGVEIVHLAEFHGDGHPQDPGPLRLPEMQAMFDECRRLSSDHLLFLPGEEANAALGQARRGKEAGHWIYLFPKPVYWTMTRGPDQLFREVLPPFGPVYHVGDGADMIALLEREGGLAWTTHPRIKGSSWTPDIFRHQDFFRSDRWLGAGWKAMPADLSHDRLGRRSLDLLDDMANWRQKKYLPGEVDVFKIDHTHELYGHMNVNYIRLDPDRLPRFDDGWQPIIDGLWSGRFFVTTGEVLIPEFSVSGRPSGARVVVDSNEPALVSASLVWTFPLQFVEIISGDGAKIYRERIDMSDTGPFGHRSLSARLGLAGRKWLRLEVWDIAGNGAFTQPVWLEHREPQP